MKPIQALIFGLLFLMGCASIHHNHNWSQTSANYKLTPEAPLAAFPPPYEHSALYAPQEISLREKKSKREYTASAKILENEWLKQFKKTPFISKMTLLSKRGEGEISWADLQKKHLGLLVEADIENLRVAYIDANIPYSFGTWLLLSGIGLWFHTEKYAIDFQVRVRVYNVYRKSLVTSFSYPVSYGENLNFHERSSGFFSYLLLFSCVWPPYLIWGDGDTILENLAPPAISQAMNELRNRLKNLRYVKKDYLEITTLGKSPEVKSLQVTYPQNHSLWNKNHLKKLDFKLILKRGKFKLRKVWIKRDNKPMILLDQPPERSVENPFQKQESFLRTNIPFEKGKIEIIIEIKGEKKFLTIQIQQKAGIEERKEK